MTHESKIIYLAPFLNNFLIFANDVRPVLESILFVVAKLGRLDQYAITAKISCVSQKWECRPKMAVSAENGGVIQQSPCSVENVLIPKLEQPCQPKMPVSAKKLLSVKNRCLPKMAEWGQNDSYRQKQT